MKRAPFTEDQIIRILRDHEVGAKTADLAHQHGVSEVTSTLGGQVRRHGRIRGQAVEAA